MVNTVNVMVVLYDLKGLFQIKRFCGSVKSNGHGYFFPRSVGFLPKLKHCLNNSVLVSGNTL